MGTFHGQREFELMIVAKAKENALNGTAGTFMGLEENDVLLFFGGRQTVVGRFRGFGCIRQIFRGHPGNIERERERERERVGRWIWP